MNSYPVFIGQQANKVIFTGTVQAMQFVKDLRSQNIVVNPKAQRSLAKGAGKETTAELLDSDSVDKTLRMKELTVFLKRVMKSISESNQSEGFFGSIQLAVPKEFTGATVQIVKDEPDNLPSALHDVLKALAPGRQLGVLQFSPQLGEEALHIGDGQGRLFGFHALERMAVKEIVKVKAAIKKMEKTGLNTTAMQKKLSDLEDELKGIRNFLSETDISFVCYAAAVQPNGQVVGLDEDAQKRQYIEGNALNSRASQEEMVKYEAFSPVVVLLQEVRELWSWMSPEYIEEDTKSVSASSTKIFTLSALAQAFSFSVLNHPKALKAVDDKSFDETQERRDFVIAYWSKVSDVFGSVWAPDLDMTHGERLVYLQERRGDQHRSVLFQAVFLMALGQLGYQMGRQAKWDPEHQVLGLLDNLKPPKVSYDAVKNYSAEPEDTTYDDQWKNAMMKQTMDNTKTPPSIKGYVFNNSRENVVATYHQLAKLAGFVIDPTQNDDSVAEEEDTPVMA